MAVRSDVTLVQLRYFIAAAESSSMTGAAERLHVAQSAVSAAVGQLEQRVGTQLFVRQRSKGLTLTPSGQQLLLDARALVRSVDEALEAARGLDNQVRGTIRVACFTTIAPFVLPSVIARLQQSHPHLEVEVEETDGVGAREALRSGRAEIAVGYEFAFGDDVRREVIADIAPHVLLPVTHPLAAAARVSLRDLWRDRMILLDLPLSREYFLGLLEAAGVRPEIRHRTENYETVRAFVGNGLGFSILNQVPAHDQTYDGSSVAVRPIADDPAGLPVVVATLRSARQTARARAVGAVFREVVQDTQVRRNVTGR